MVVPRVPLPHRQFLPLRLFVASQDNRRILSNMLRCQIKLITSAGYHAASTMLSRSVGPPTASGTLLLAWLCASSVLELRG